MNLRRVHKVYCGHGCGAGACGAGAIGAVPTALVALGTFRLGRPLRRLARHQ